MIAKIAFVFFVVGVALAAEVQVNNCKICGTDTEPFQNKLPQRVDVDDCTELPCLLMGQKVEMSFILEEDVTDLTHYKKGQYGVCREDKAHDTSAKDNIYFNNGTKATFPLRAYTRYIHRQDLPSVRTFLPVKLPTVFALLDQNKKPVVCYQMSVQSTSPRARVFQGYN